MTELEKIAYARSFIERLANGINPVDNTPIPKEDVASNERLKKCFAYVSDILKQVYDNGGIGKIERTIAFSITNEEASRFEFTTYPISGTDISKKLASIVNNPQMKSFSVVNMNKWLMKRKLLCESADQFGKIRKMPTALGKELGISAESKIGHDGEYIAILYDSRAQHLIIDNIQAILNEKD